MFFFIIRQGDFVLWFECHRCNLFPVMYCFDTFRRKNSFPFNWFLIKMNILFSSYTLLHWSILIMLSKYQVQIMLHTNYCKHHSWDGAWGKISGSFGPYHFLESKKSMKLAGVTLNQGYSNISKMYYFSFDTNTYQYRCVLMYRFKFIIFFKNFKYICIKNIKIKLIVIYLD